MLSGHFPYPMVRQSGHLLPPVQDMSRFPEAGVYHRQKYLATSVNGGARRKSRNTLTFRAYAPKLYSFILYYLGDSA
jgi:hypothetical protein